MTIPTSNNSFHTRNLSPDPFVVQHCCILLCLSVTYVVCLLLGFCGRFSSITTSHHCNLDLFSYSSALLGFLTAVFCANPVSPVHTRPDQTRMNSCASASIARDTWHFMSCAHKIWMSPFLFLVVEKWRSFFSAFVYFLGWKYGDLPKTSLWPKNRFCGLLLLINLIFKQTNCQQTVFCYLQSFVQRI